MMSSEDSKGGKLTASTLCSTCSAAWAEAYDTTRDLTNLSIRYEEEHDYPDLGDLQSKANAGCDFCSLLRNALREEARRWFRLAPEDIPSCPIILNRLDIALYDETIDSKPKLNGERSATGHCYVFVEFPKAAMAKIGYSATIFECVISVLLDRAIDDYHATDPLLPKNVELVQNFLHQCAIKHYKCIDAQSKFFPTRLLDVTANDDTIRLVESKSIAENSRYVALSYCWGPPRAGVAEYKTIPSNAQSRLLGFSLADQPPAVQDAVRVTRALGISFLWIDALCIIQGDKDDWEREGMQMDKVYENAYVTIAAVATETVWDSFLARPTICTEVSIEKVNALGEERDMATLRFRYPSQRDEPNFLVDCPWSLRAWTMQEQALATRTLHFTPQQFYLECLCDQQLELTAHKLPDKTPRPWHLESTTQAAQTLSSQQAFNDWYTIVEQYTTRQITYESDRIIAIAGLAQRVSRQIQNAGYGFGLFKADIARGLLWTREDTQRQSVRNQAVPTWSWASLPGPVSYGILHGEDSYPANMIEIQPCPSPEVLVVSGKILPSSGIWPSAKTVPERDEVDAGGTESETWQLWHDSEGDVDVLSTQVLAVCKTEYEVSGLLLRKSAQTTSNNVDMFTRVGYFELSHEYGPSLFDTVEKTLVALI